MHLTSPSTRILMRAPCKIREAVTTGFSQTDMKAGMGKAKQALHPRPHCGSGKIAPEHGTYCGVDTSRLLSGGSAVARGETSFVREDMPAVDAATRERYLQA